MITIKPYKALVCTDNMYHIIKDPFKKIQNTFCYNVFKVMMPERKIRNDFNLNIIDEDDPRDVKQIIPAHIWASNIDFYNENIYLLTYNEFMYLDQYISGDDESLFIIGYNQYVFVSDSYKRISDALHTFNEYVSLNPCKNKYIKNSSDFFSYINAFIVLLSTTISTKECMIEGIYNFSNFKLDESIISFENIEVIL